MTWGKVDDKLHGHPKTMSARLEAMGLWVVALSYGCDYMTDGHIRPEHAARLANGAALARRLAARLCDAGFWHLADAPCDSAECDALRQPAGTPGWRFHDWADHQPTKAGMLSKRLDAAERKRESRSRRIDVTCDGVVTAADVTRDGVVSHSDVTDLSSRARVGLGTGSDLGGGSGGGPGTRPAPAPLPPEGHDVLAVLRDGPLAAIATGGTARRVLERWTCGRPIAGALEAISQVADRATDAGWTPDTMRDRVFAFVSQANKSSRPARDDAPGLPFDPQDPDRAERHARIMAVAKAPPYVPPTPVKAPRRA